MSLYKINALDFYDNEISVKVDKEPDFCPICHKHIKPIHVISLLNGESNKSSFLQRVYKCPNDKCKSAFFGFYKGILDKPRSFVQYSYYKLTRLQPAYPKEPKVSDDVKEISNDFYNIYKQAIDAEERGLTELCGMGYRKALEFLIKDYIITVLKIDYEKIKKTSISTCINNYIEDSTTKKISERAVWLGNDHSHYYKKWQTKDLEDLKILLELSINAIHNQIKAKKYIEEMK